MTTSVVFNILQICRGCLSDNRDSLRSIFDSNILDNFISCTNVQVCVSRFSLKSICLQTIRSLYESKIFFSFLIFKVTDKDDLPKLICSSCVYKVISWVTFKSQCEKNDEILRNTFHRNEVSTSQSNDNNQSIDDGLTSQNEIDCKKESELLQPHDSLNQGPSGQFSKIDRWNADGTENVTQYDERLTDVDEPVDEEEVYENEVIFAVRSSSADQ